MNITTSTHTSFLSFFRPLSVHIIIEHYTSTHTSFLSFFRPLSVHFYKRIEEFRKRIRKRASSASSSSSSAANANPNAASVTADAHDAQGLLQKVCSEFHAFAAEAAAFYEGLVRKLEVALGFATFTHIKLHEKFR